MSRDPAPSDLGDMPPDEFRNQARALVEWIAAYLSTDEHPVLSRVQPGDIRNALPSSPPESGTPFDQIFRDFETLLLPGITHWNHPGFLGRTGPVDRGITEGRSVCQTGLVQKGTF